MNRATVAVLGIALVFGTLSTPPAAHASAPSVALVVVDRNNQPIATGFTDATMTPDGRYVAFATAASLVLADQNGLVDVYVRDRSTGGLLWVSTPAADATDAQNGYLGNSSHPSISADGTRIAFESKAQNLVRSDAFNAGSTVYVRDLRTRTTQVAGVRLDGSYPGPGNTDSSPFLDDWMLPVISADGRVVVFTAPDSAIDTGSGSSTFHLFARDLSQPASERIDVGVGAAPANAAVTFAAASVSSDGARIAFASTATNLIGIGSDTNASSDVFVRDRKSATTARVSVLNGGGEAAGESSAPSISADGTLVAFQSFAANLVTGDINDTTDVFVRDTTASSTSRVSITATGSELKYSSTDPAISGDGRFVTYRTLAPVIGAADTNNALDVYQYARSNGGIQLLSIVPTGGGGTGTAAVGTSGRLTLFGSGWLRDTGGNTAPSAVVSVAKNGLEVTADGRGSSDPDGWVTNYQWTFGDGYTLNGKNPLAPHVFVRGGSYSVVLTVTDNDGATTTFTTTIDVTSETRPPTTRKAPKNLSRPKLKGKAQVGRTLRCAPGRWTEQPSLTYRWQRDGRTIRKAKTKKLRLSRSYRGHLVRCVVRAKSGTFPVVKSNTRAVRVTARKR